MNNNILINIYLSLGIFILFSFQTLDFRIDLTKNERFTLKDKTVLKIKEIESKISIDVYLSGDLPYSYRKLHTETKEILNSFTSINKNLNVKFINPFNNNQTIESVINKMSSYGMNPDYIIKNNKQSIDQKVIFPWIKLNDNKNSVLISLTDSNLGESNEQIVVNGIEQLEYKIIDGLFRLNNNKKSKLAFITSHETSPNIKISDWINELQMYYKVIAFDLKKYKSNPSETFNNLTTFPLIIISNPKESFSQEEKFILDQYQINGGNILWLINTVKIDVETLYENNGKTLGISNYLNLDDYFFNYELRINTELIKDIYCAALVIANGTGNNTKYLPFPWVYYPISKPNNNNIISNGVGNLWFRFTSSIDTLKGFANKKILVKSSNYNQQQSIPSIIDLNTAIEPIELHKYNSKSKPLIVLSEGNFSSLFENRIHPISILKYKNNGNSKFILIADGEFGESQIENDKTLELGYDKWTNNFYSNKIFLMNSVHYLINNYDLLEIRSKEVKLNFLDKVKITNRGTFQSVIFLITPLFFLFGLNILFIKYRNYN